MNANSSTTNSWLGVAEHRLKDAGIATARLDCLILLEDATGKDRSWLLAHPEYVCQARSLTLLNEQITRRSLHEPLAYIRGKSEFYGREFKVTHDTLQPRPETETMIELLLDLADSGQLTADSFLVDVGTGSGCLGITAKLEVPGVEVIATDVSEGCLGVARQNAENLGAKISFYQGDLFQSPEESTFYIPPGFIVLANLPYVPDGHTINQAAMQEPPHAIFGGKDGLDLYRRMFAQIKEYGLAPEFILTESLPFQHEALAKIAQLSGYKLEKTEDFIQLFVLSS